MAKFTIETLLTKLSNVFKADLYIIQNQFCIGGTESEENNIGTSIVVLDPDRIELCKETFGNHDIVYINDIKKAKEDLQSHIKTKMNKQDEESVLSTKNFLMKLVMKTEIWKSFEFTEEDIVSIFKNGDGKKLFEDEPDIPTVTISKSLFPMVTEKKASTLVYQIYVPKNKNELVNLITYFNTEWFQIYTLFQYINIE